MSKILEVVDSLENRISKLVYQFDKQKVKNEELSQKVIQLEERQQQSLQQIEQWKETCHSLKIANSMLGSDQHKRETKLKINALVKEIDQCISQLSE